MPRKEIGKNCFVKKAKLDEFTFFCIRLVVSPGCLNYDYDLVPADVVCDLQYFITMRSVK